MALIDLHLVSRTFVLVAVWIFICGVHHVDGKVDDPWDLMEDKILLSAHLARSFALRPLTSEEQSNTLKVLEAFKFAMPSLNWTGSDFCTWSGVSCFGSNITLVATDTPAAGTLPEMPNHVNYSLVMIDQINFLNKKTAVWGTLPESWSKLRKVRSINLAYTNVSGPLPATWSSIESLQYLTLSFSSVSGTLPASWSSMASMRFLTISNTHITGTLPEEWKSMPRAERIYLQRNNLQGTLPSSWAHMPSLNLLGLQGNKFCGCIPASWNSSTRISVGVDSKHRRSDCEALAPCTQTTSTSTTTTTAAPKPSPNISSSTSNASSLVSSSSENTTNDTTTTTTEEASRLPTYPSCRIPNCLWCSVTHVNQCAVCCCGYMLTAAGTCIRFSEDAAVLPVTASGVSVLTASLGAAISVLLA